MKFAAIMLGTGAILGVTADRLIRKTRVFIRNRIESWTIADTLHSSKVYTVHSDRIDLKDVQFSIGDQFRVLEQDGDAILIEKLGDKNNPYFVSANLLRSISDFVQ